MFERAYLLAEKLIARLERVIELGKQTELLQALLGKERTDVLEVAVSDGLHREMVLERFPVAGAKRVIANRTTTGNDNLGVPTTGVLVVGANSARLGGLIVNAGATPVILYLNRSGLATPGAGAIYLAAGASWDFRLGNLLWCGSVSAVAQGASSTLTLTEV